MNIITNFIIKPCNAFVYATKALHTITKIALIQLVNRPSPECRNFLKLDAKWRRSYGNLKWNEPYKRPDGSILYRRGSELMLRTGAEESPIAAEESREFYEYERIIERIPKQYRPFYKRELLIEQCKNELKE